MKSHDFQLEYRECLWSTFLNPDSWAVVLVGLGLAFMIWKVGWRRSSVGLAVASMVVGTVWAYGYYEMSCIEIYQ